MPIHPLLSSNQAWSARMHAQDPSFFSRLENLHAPKYLWIGCSDSRVPANQITGLAPGEIFVHRNIANQVPHSDCNSHAVLQFALEHLRIDEVIVCGHYGCSGIEAALQGRSQGLVDSWLRAIQDLQRLHQDSLQGLSPEVQASELAEWNVRHQVLHVAESASVQEAWKQGRAVVVHGWIYSLSDGLIRDLGVTLRQSADVVKLRSLCYSSPYNQ